MRPSKWMGQALRAVRGAAGTTLLVAATLSALLGPAHGDAPGAAALGRSILPPLPGPPKAAAMPESESAPSPSSLPSASPPALSGATGAVEPAPAPSAQIPPAASGASEAATEPAAAESLAAARRRAIDAARRVQEGERALAAIRHEIGLLGSDVDARSRSLAGSRAEQQRLLDTVLHLARNPARIGGPDGGDGDAPLIERLRAEALIRETDPALRAGLRALTGEIARLEALQKRVAARKSDEAAARQALAAEREQLAKAVAQRSALLREMAPPQSIDTALRIADTEREAKTLSELLKRVEAAEERSDKPRERGRTGRSRNKPEPLPPQDDPTRPANLRSLLQESGLDEGGTSSDAGEPGAAPPHAPLVPPVAGAVTGRDGEPGADVPKDGVSFEAGPGAAVVAPFDGKIVYAGPFRELGRVLIIRHDRRYYSVLAGLGRVDAKLGDWVLAGEPVGATPEIPSPHLDAQAREEDQSDPGRLLYYELRRDGRPVDPQPWLAHVEDGHDVRNGEQKVSQ